MKLDQYLFTSVALVAGVFSTAAANVPKHPNILYIMADDHAAEAIGAYGGRLAAINPTPNLDKLAADGMVFQNVFSVNPLCSPARAAVITGQYSQNNGVLVIRHTQGIKPAHQYLPLALDKLGYQTGIVGKWHLVYEPAAFDDYKVFNGQGSYWNPLFREKSLGSWPNDTKIYKGHSTAIITRLGLDWLKHRDKSKPFFFMLCYKAPHDNFDYAPQYKDYLKNVEIPEPASLYPQNEPHFGSVAIHGTNDSLIHLIGSSISMRNYYRSYARQYHINTVTNTPDQVTHLAYQEYLKRYLRCVKGVDDHVQKVFDYLKANGLWTNTIIIYTSDQGMMLGEHDFQDKRWPYEPSLRIPFIVHYPPTIKPGSRTDELISQADIAPTIITLAGGKPPVQMQGRSFASLILHDRPPAHPHKAIYCEYFQHMFYHGVPANFAIRTAKYKLIFYYGLPYDMNLMGRPLFPWVEHKLTPDQKKGIIPEDVRPPTWVADQDPVVTQTPPGWELYDLSKDPKETYNRYNDPKYRKIIISLKNRLSNLRKKLNETDAKFPQIQKVVNEHWDDTEPSP